jgi:chromosome segregation ATPase
MDPPPSSEEPAMQLRINTDIDAVLAAHAPESPTTMLVDTLRTELTTLTDQASVLNAKLLASLDRVATLEDTVYQHTTAEREKDAQIVQLERAKAQWEESMNTGLLVERTAVKAEMQRLVEGLVEEERRRGSAEEGRARVENEVDDLSATLFEQVRLLFPNSQFGLR